MLQCELRILSHAESNNFNHARSNVMCLRISAVALAPHVTSQAVQATVAVYWITRFPRSNRCKPS